MDLGLKDAAAVVVGGGRGMGFAAARCLAEDGARVAVVGRTQAVLDEAADTLSRCGSPDAVGLVVDITDHFDAKIHALKAHGDVRLFIATKCGLSRSPDGGALVDNRPETIRQSCEASLARLGTDYIDLFYLHRIDPGVPIEESTGALAELVRAGKIRYAGLSECSEATLRRACKVLPIAAVQSEYSIWSRDPEQGVLAACEELEVTFVSYSPLGRGFLAGNFRQAEDLPENDHRRRHPRFQQEAAAHNARLVEAIGEIAAGMGATTAQVAIAWVLSRSPRVVTIPGMKKRTHLADNLRAAGVRLTEAQTARLDDLAPQVTGERHPPAMMKILDR